MSLEYALRMYPPYQEKQTSIAQTDPWTDPQKRNLVGFIIYILLVKNLYSGDSPSRFHKLTLVHTCAPRGAGVAKRWAVFVYIYKTPL